MRLPAKNRNKLRMAVGSVDGLRSTVWEVFSTRSEFYVISRMMGRSCKISLHSSGYCQWATFNNRDSPTGVVAFARTWKIIPPTGSEALHVFRIIVPSSELHLIGEDEDLDDVTFYPAQGHKEAFYFEIYLSGPMQSKEVGMESPHPVVGAFKLNDHRCVIVLWRHEAISDVDCQQLERLKRSMQEAPMNQSLEPSSNWRGVGFVPPEGRGIASFIECAPWA